MTPQSSNPTRLAIFGDVHGNSAATAATLAAIETAAPDAVYCLGDLVGYGARPNETIDLVRAREIPTLMGNYDDGVGFDRDDCGCAYKDDGERDRGQASLIWSRAVVTPDRKAYLQALLPEIRLEIAGLRLRLVHGSPRRMNEYLFEDRDARSLERIAAGADCDILIFGHTSSPGPATSAASASSTPAAPVSPRTATPTPAGSSSPWRPALRPA